MLRHFQNLLSAVRCISTRCPQRIISTTTSNLQDFVDQESSFTAVATKQLPILNARTIEFADPGKAPKQAWLETLSIIENEKQGIVELHPDIFASFPRVDILWENVHWQQFYSKINFDKVKNRAELRGGGRKPWPQKGTGRARHGSIRSPLWKGGGKSFGPRGPKSYFYMLPQNKRVLGLRTALTCKYAQDRLHIVDSLDIPSENPEYLEELMEMRGWGLSVLFVDNTDVIPHNMALAVDAIKPYNVMPVYGLNVYSMLKHETLVLTLDALDKIEEKLLAHMNTAEFRDLKFNRRTWNSPTL